MVKLFLQVHSYYYKNMVFIGTCVFIHFLLIVKFVLTIKISPSKVASFFPKNNFKNCVLFTIYNSLQYMHTWLKKWNARSHRKKWKTKEKRKYIYKFFNVFNNRFTIQNLGSIKCMMYLFNMVSDSKFIISLLESCSFYRFCVLINIFLIWLILCKKN